MAEVTSDKLKAVLIESHAECKQKMQEVQRIADEYAIAMRITGNDSVEFATEAGLLALIRAIQREGIVL
jgi:hypothetical protein